MPFTPGKWASNQITPWQASEHRHALSGEARDRTDKATMLGCQRQEPLGAHA